MAALKDISPGFLDELRRDGVHFMFASQRPGQHPTGEPERDFINFYQSLVLSQGLRQLAIPFSANETLCCPAGQPESAAVFQKTVRDPKAAALLVVDVSQIPSATLGRPAFAEQLASIPARRKVLFYRASAGQSFYFKDGPLFFVSHESEHLALPGRRFAWPFGVSEQIISATAKRQSRERDGTILRNFRPSGAQSVREALDLAFVPNLERNFTLRRKTDEIGHYLEGYFDRLATASAVLTYCGAFYTNPITNPRLKAQDDPGSSWRWSDVKFLRDPIIMRWDSWRFWETLAAGAVAISLDAERYGFAMPVKPQNWVHYIGLDLSNLKADAERLADERARLPEIGAAGRRWVLEHYSPLPIANRFLHTVEGLA